MASSYSEDFYLATKRVKGVVLAVKEPFLAFLDWHVCPGWTASLRNLCCQALCEAKGRVKCHHMTNTMMRRIASRIATRAEADDKETSSFLLLLVRHLLLLAWHLLLEAMHLLLVASCYE